MKYFFFTASLLFIFVPVMRIFGFFKSLIEKDQTFIILILMGIIFFYAGSWIENYELKGISVQDNIRRTSAMKSAKNGIFITIVALLFVLSSLV